MNPALNYGGTELSISQSQKELSKSQQEDLKNDGLPTTEE